MIGPEDKKYDVPENYSSKSKLVQGDKLKLIITSEGRFIYKQIGPMERQTKKGVILFNDEGEQYYVSADGVEYKVLRASITYYKGEIGDTAVILVPQGQLSAWAAVDHIIKDSSISEPTSIESKENNVEDVEKIEKIDEVEKEEAVNGGLEEI
jgi:hypothetical protein